MFHKLFVVVVVVVVVVDALKFKNKESRLTNGPCRAAVACYTFIFSYSNVLWPTTTTITTASTPAVTATTSRRPKVNNAMLFIVVVVVITAALLLTFFGQFLWQVYIFKCIIRKQY